MERILPHFRNANDDINSRAGITLGAEKVDVDHIQVYEGEFVSDIKDAEPQTVDTANTLTTTWAALKS